MSKVIDKDMGWQAILDQCVRGGEVNVAAYVGPDHKDFAADGEPYYPLWIEYGTSKLPPRPFIRWTLDAHDNYRAEMVEMARRIIGRRGRKEARGKIPLSADLALVARRVARDIKQTIQGMGIIDTGRMFRSVRVLRIVNENGVSTGGDVAANWGG